MNYQLLGKLIANLRQEKRISQSQLSEDLKISRTTISSLENGRGDISVKKLLMILTYLEKEIKIIDKTSLPTFEQLRDELKHG